MSKIVPEISAHRSFVAYARAPIAEMVDQQLQAIVAKIQDVNVAVACIGVYKDQESITTSLAKPRALSQLLDDIATGRLSVTLLVVESHDRLGRQPQFVDTVQKLLANHGVRVLAINDLSTT